MINIALSYAKRGWHVFPVTNKKVPFPNTHGHKEATADEAKIRSFWKRFPKANVAIATGRKSGIFVLDIDVKDCKVGDDSLFALEKKYGSLPDSVECITWSGGRQIYFKYPQNIEIHNSQGKVGKDLDIRGEGGYVVAPGSIVNGKRYEWEIAHQPNDTPVADAPDWLIDLILRNKPEVYVADDDKFPEGQRNSGLMVTGVKLRKAGLDFAQIESSLQSINKSKCVPPLPNYEVTRIAKSVSRYSDGKVKGRKPSYTDVWSAELFYETYGDCVRYCDALGGWFIWDGSRWLKDETFQIIKLAMESVKNIFALAEANKDKDLMKHAVKSESEAKLKSMVNLARSKGNIAVRHNQFDKNVYLLNCRNGTLNLSTGELYPHNKDDFITKKIEIDYKKDADCPEWKKFLNSIFQGDTQLIDFMQKAIGYSLSGSIKEQCIFILYGIGMNGKSTFLKHIFRILGDYAINTPATTLMEKYNDTIPNDIARLNGTRFVTAVESGKSKSLAEAQIKQLTGDDPISARFLHHEYFDFFATFKIFFATNHKPNISGTDKGIWRRIKTIPFEKVIAPEERDDKLDEKLASEYEGILNWAVEGFQKWLNEGLKEASKIQQATDEYKEESDVIGNYIQEQCVKGEKCYVSATHILKDLQDWAKDNGYHQIKRNVFVEYMKQHGFKHERLSAGINKGRYHWFGIGMRSETNEPLTNTDIENNSFLSSKNYDFSGVKNTKNDLYYETECPF